MVVSRAVSFLYFIADEVAARVYHGHGDELAESVTASLLRGMTSCRDDPDVQVRCLPGACVVVCGVSSI